MIIFPKKDIIPIIIPQICFNDKYNNINNYVEMNPSLFIDEKGKVQILVRCVNYKKFPEKQFTLYESKSNSIYYNITGNIRDSDKLDIETFEYNILKYEYNLQIFTSHWTGLEDIRFIDANNVLVIVPELNEGGNPSIFKAEINNNKMTHFCNCKPNIVEKNWMPYQDNTNNTNNTNSNTYKVIYSLHPFIIKSIDNDDLQEIELSETIQNKLAGYHGSTNGIFINKYERLFLIHVNKNITHHRWLLFNIKTNTITLSEEFVFFKNSYIEFTCSLANYNNRIFITIGVNDNKAFLIETCYTDIIELFPKCNNNVNFPTIVTMLYDIRSMENNTTERNRKLDSYIDFSCKFLLKLPFPLVIFIDDNEETYDAIYNVRKDVNLLDSTYIYVCDFKTTYFYKYLPRLQELQQTFHILNGEIEHETPLYVILNNNKFDCIDKTIQRNPFNSSHFIWMDFGINHVAQSTDAIYEWIHKVPDKIKQLCINPYTETNSPKTHFQCIYHNMAGGLFSGSMENMKKYSELFKNKTEEIYNDNWYQIDEAVMTMVHRENPQLFDLYYGDYHGIVSNYLYPVHNIDLIFKSSQKYLDYNKTKEAYSLLCYCAKYFEMNPHCDFVFYYIQQNIITNYYNNHRLLLPNVINLINFKKDSDNEHDRERIHILLENNKTNIEYYENKEFVLGLSAEM